MKAQEHGPESHSAEVLDTVIKMSDRAPAYRGPVLHFDALRLVALRERDGTEETFATESEGGCLLAHLRTYAQPAQLFAAGASFQPTPSPLCELACWPLLGVLLYVFGE